MEEYEVLIFPLAQKDLTDIVEYLNELSPDAAINIYDEIVESILSLAYMPLRYPLLKNHALYARGYRMLIVHNYLVFYIVNEATVEIRRILYGSRQYEFLI